MADTILNATTAGPTLDTWMVNILRYQNSPLDPLPATVVTQSLQTVPNPLLTQRAAIQDLAQQSIGTSSAAALEKVIDMADATTTVALMNYQFFTGRVPTDLGLNFLVNSSINLADLNDGYYAGMAIENRYINFAVNLGKLGAGAAGFNASYGALSLNDATAKAYGEIFGVAPSAAKVAAILGGSVVFAGHTGTRADYLTSLGGDAIGTKAAMVGYLLGEAAKADVGVYSVMTENLLAELSDGTGGLGTDAHIYLVGGPHVLDLTGLG